MSTVVCKRNKEDTSKQYLMYYTMQSKQEAQQDCDVYNKGEKQGFEIAGETIDCNEWFYFVDEQEEFY